mgnify:CR=1 FL=1
MVDPRRFKWPPLLRWSLTLLMLTVLAWILDTDRLIEELTRFSMSALLLALLVSVAQVVLSAWRWRYTAQRLGLNLALPTAVREYYLASFLNQCLPGGVIGDINRAWRHGMDSGQRRASLHAVMIERLSGQLAMLALALGAGIWLVMVQGYWLSPPAYRGGDTWLLALVVLALVIVVVVGASLWRKCRSYLKALGRDLRRGLLNLRALPVQLVTSLLVVASYLLVFWLLASSSYHTLSLVQSITLIALCCLLLLAMVVPLTVAGWGLREGAAAVLWPLAGLPAEQGVALSVGYGLTVLVSSLPGSLFVFTGIRTPADAEG